MRVLVVEDDRDLGENVLEALELGDHLGALATDGEIALQVLADEPLPQAILLDLMMPRLDGWQVLERLRRDERVGRVPVVITTASDDPPPVVLPVVAILRKPYSLEQLFAVLEGIG